MTQNGDNLIIKQNQIIERALRNKPTFHSYYKEDRNRVRLFTMGEIIDNISKPKRIHIGVTLVRSNSSDIPHLENISFINSQIAELTCPLGYMLNAAYKIIETRINDEEIRGNKFNDLATLKNLIDSLVTSGDRITPNYTLALFNTISYAPITIRVAEDKLPFDYLVDCLADVVFHTLYHLHVIYPKGFYIKQCVVCGKLFFSGDARAIICYFPNAMTDSYRACETEREKTIISQDPVRKELNALLHMLRQRFSGRKNLPDKDWIEEFNEAYRMKRGEIKNDSMIYFKLLNWVKDYDSKDRLLQERMRQSPVK